MEVIGLKTKMIVFLLFLLFSPTKTFADYIVQSQDPYHYNQLVEDLAKLTDRYRNILEIREIGKSEFGKTIWAVKLGKGEENIVLVGTHHAREWISTNLLMVMLERYAETYQTGEMFGEFDPAILDDVAIWFVPMLNPDGVDIQQGELPPQYKRKLILMNKGSMDFTRWKANGLGLDLNRQYPAGWDELPTEDGPSFKGYKGKQPIEGKEVQAFIQFVKDINPKSAIAYHSAGHVIYWQYGDRQNIFRDYFLASSLAKLTGYRLDTPSIDATGGGFTDWFIEEYGRPAFTLELTDHEGESHPPMEKFHEEWIRNQFVGFYLASEMAHHKK